MKKETNWDCIVIGGGPAGSCASTVLAQKNRRVVVFEKEKFPRYHIGESMMPLCYFPLQRVGLIEKMKGSHYVKKYSVQFVNSNGKLSHPFYFFKYLDHESAVTWQVTRGEFDKMLLDNARENGATVHEETQVKELVKENGFVVGVRVQDKQGKLTEHRAPMTIDCSGRDALTVARNDWRVRDPYLNKIAIWSYFAGAKRDPGLDEGATTVAYIPDKGWFWYIPLQDDVISVGVVAEKDYLFKDTRDLEEIFWREVGNNPWIEEHVKGSRCFGKFFTTGEYSYRSRHCAADGVILAGDAFAFLDPVFSSGLFLALKSGVMAGDAVDAALTAGDYSAKQFAPYGATMCEGIENMRKLVYAFYDHAFHFREMFVKYPELKGPVTDCLIGDLFKDYDHLFSKVVEFAKLPTPITHGKPLVAASV